MPGPAAAAAMPVAVRSGRCRGGGGGSRPPRRRAPPLGAGTCVRRAGRGGGACGGGDGKGRGGGGACPPPRHPKKAPGGSGQPPAAAASRWERSGVRPLEGTGSGGTQGGLPFPAKLRWRLIEKGLKRSPSPEHPRQTAGGREPGDTSRSEGAKERGREGRGMALMNVVSQGS